MFQKKNRGRDSKKRTSFRRRTFKHKVCHFCVNKVKEIDYRDVLLLKKYVTERGKILSQRISGTCTKHQRRLGKAVKRARNVGLLPFVAA